jgi:transketolase
MRRQFFKDLYDLMEHNQNIFVLTADLGYGGFDKIREKHNGTRFFNVGACEQAMAGIAVGLALEGRTVFCYSITPFLLWRAAETLRLYVNHEKIPVILIGSGRDMDYAHDGFSHDATDAQKILNVFENIKSYWPNDKKQIKGLLQTVIKEKHPCFISLKR